jgi:Lon protease-like protein
MTYLGGMIKHGDLPDTLPLFPLPGALLLPRARLPLHIFAPR